MVWKSYDWWAIQSKSKDHFGLFRLGYLTDFVFRSDRSKRQENGGWHREPCHAQLNNREKGY